MEIIGHKKIISLLDRAIARDAVSQTYLFYGPESVGKFTVALEFAKKIVENKEKINSDLIVVRPEREEKKGIIKEKEIKIEQIRDLRHQLSLKAHGGHRVAIIDDAQRLNKTAQNALLKTLEEASDKVVLILVANGEKKLLPTIISRCQKVRFSLVSEREMGSNISGNAKNGDEIISWSLGRPGLMLDFMDDPEAFEERKKSIEEIEKIFSGKVLKKFALAEELSKDAVSAAEKLNLWTVVLRKNILENKNPLKSLRLIGQIEKSLDLLRGTNSNAKLVLENLLLQF